MNEFFEKTGKFLKGLPLIGDLLEQRPKVYVMRFSGVIMDSGGRRPNINHARYAKVIDKVFDRSDIQAIALVINSPGGSAAQTSLLANHIRRLADKKEVPVFAFIEDVAASGGYWLACVADEIYAQESSIVGSIGVISAGFGFEDFIEKHDIHRRLYSAGKNKSFLDPFVPEKEEDLARLTEIQQDIHTLFKEWVRERRGDKLQTSDKDLFEGGFWTAGPALSKGLVDGIGDVRTIAEHKYNEDFKLVDMTPDRKLSLFPFLGRTESAGIGDDILDTLENRAFWARYGL